MMFKKYLGITAIAAFAFIWSGCAFIFVPGRQKVFFKTATPAAKIVYENDSIGIGTAKKKLRKAQLFQSVSVEKEGYKTRNYCFQLTKMTPYYALTVLDVFLFLGPLWENRYFPKLHKYNKHQVIPDLLLMESRKSDEKYLLVDNTTVDTKGIDLNFALYTGIKRFQTKTLKPYTPSKKHSKAKKKEDLKIGNTIFTDQLNYSLKKMNFIDTTHTIFPNVSNSLYVNATIKKITFHEVSYRKPDMNPYGDHLLCVELEIDWDILDYYKQSIYTTHTSKKSDLFVFHRDGSTGEKSIANVVNDALGDNLQYALLDVRKELNEKKLLIIGSGDKNTDTQALIELVKPTPNLNPRVNDFLTSTVSVKIDDGHGSGVIISSDGYIVTNYHVVAGSKKIEVIFNDGSKADAIVIRKNAEADLALIKVNKDSLKPLLISDSKQPEIGIDVWAIGTPKSLELGQSVSKGIISGIRKANEIAMLQTDVKISPGNSGGALVNKEGVVLGIISSKLMGFGTEGVGFAITAYQVLEKLKIKYK